LSPDDCSQLGKCSVRSLPPNLPEQTPIEVRFRYEENGRLTVQVQVQGTGKQLQHEIMRENSLTQDQLDSWRKHVSGLEPIRQQPSAAPTAAPAHAAAPTAKPAARSAASASLPRPATKAVPQTPPKPPETDEIVFEELVAEALEMDEEK
jgi:molecular chaperone DnaK (HSP70)